MRWPDDQLGGWHLPSDTTEAYCRRIVSEGRVKKPSGSYLWVQRWRDNHFLDCEGDGLFRGVHAGCASRRRLGAAPQAEAKTTPAGHAGRQDDNEHRSDGVTRAKMDVN